MKIIRTIEGKEDGRFEIAILIFEVLHVGGEHIGEISHYHGDVLKGLMLGFGVHHRKYVIECGIYLEIVESGQSIERFWRGHHRKRRFFWHRAFIVIVDHLSQLHFSFVDVFILLACLGW